ncbi:ECF transporter S component [Bacillus timonensis]|nr:ECF transporter S component [Bacillus timonensis]
MKRKELIRFSFIVFPLFFLGVSVFYFSDYFLGIGIAVLSISLLLFFWMYERKQIGAKEIVMFSTLAAIAAVSRIPFSMLPSVQPTTFIIIICGLVFGAESGFLIGAIAAFVSNMFLGQGPWTPWQMYSWGLIGFLAGLGRNSFLFSKIWGISLYGFFAGFLFGWIMNVWFIVGLLQEISLKAIFTYFITSFYFDLTHAISNVIFIIIFGKYWIKILKRFKSKYGLLHN